MTCRPDRALLAALLALLALPALAGGRGDPLVDAAAAIERGDGVSAEVSARRALAEGRPHAAVDAYLGEAALLQGDADEARRWLAAGQFDPASAHRGFYALGRLELAAADYDAAAQAFDQALQAGPADARLWVDIGRLRYRSGEQHLAADAVNRALAIDPREPQALEFQAELVRDAQGLAAALPWFERALRLAPRDMDLLGDYAATLGDLGRSDDALAVARKMAAIDRAHPRGYFVQAVLAARAGDDELARRLLARTGGAYDDTPSGMLFEGVLEYRAGNSELAVEKFDKLARLQPDNETVGRLLGRALLADGDASEVVARFAARAARADASPYMLTLVARAYEQLDRRDLAAPLLDRAARPGEAPLMAMAPADESRPALFQSSGGDTTAADVTVPTLRQLLAGHAMDAIAYGRKLRARFPQSSDIEVLAGDAALLGGDAGQALAFYRSAAAVRWTPALAERIAFAETRLGHGDRAQAEIAACLAQHPQDRGLVVLSGRAAAAGGDWRRAAALLGRAARLGDGAGDPLLWADLADAQLHLGDGVRALANAKRAYALQRMSPRATAVLAAALQASGRPADAAILFAKARALGA